jgi:DNA-binding XRE family transcriptional regulator
MPMIPIQEKIKYPFASSYNWILPFPSKITLDELEDVCKTCDSIKDKEIKKLKPENEKLKKLVKFLRSEIETLELKTALSEKAISLKDMVNEFTSTQEGKIAWEKAWENQFIEWHELMKQGKMSQIKYYRLINGIDQKTLAEKLRTAQPNISRIEKPKYNVPAKTLKKLAEIFGVKVEDLIGD